MMKYLQKLGKALMLPVAVLPICGILMGLGYALAPGVMGVPDAPTSGAAYTVGFLLVKAGGALIDNMAWLFAIGAAVGLADNDGTAGLAGLVSFLMMQQLLNPGVVSMVRTLEEGTATYIAFQKVAGNSFIGILAAVVGAACYSKFKDIQMPDWLAFFSGKRFVAIATGVISILVSIVLLFVWPVIFGALVAIGNGIAGMGGIGAGIYAFLNRLLIPTGLHHALNNVFWFDTNQRVALVEHGTTGWLEDYAARLARNCTAVICYNDEIAYQLLGILLQAGVRVPQQLAIISFDNSHYSSLGAVGLTSLAPDPGKLGSLSAQAVLELVRGSQAQSQKLPWKLVTRKST